MKESTRAHAIEILNSPTCEWTIEKAKSAIEQEKKSIEFWKEHSFCWEAGYLTRDAENRIEFLEAVIAILMEREAEQEAMENVISCYAEVPCRLVRKIVAVMANKLRKIGLSLSSAFKRAWEFVKFCVTHKHLIEKIVT